MAKYKCLICGFETYYLDTISHLEIHKIDLNKEYKNRPKDKTGHKFVYPKRYFYKSES